ncbi:MAG TPA: head maturation protease, ClpP-related [Terriglobales bacterium]|nr:head maturation protease, ClpP-related [Terriglobales bacterium]
MKTPWKIKGSGRGNLEILLYDEIGESYSGEGTTARAFAEDLGAAGPGITDIHLRVNSPGGNCFDGISMYNCLLTHGARITATVEGLAASIASVIIMAAERISMAQNALLMIHNPYAAVLGGDANDLRKMAATLDKVRDSMIVAYQRHAKNASKAELAAMMNEESWFSASEARSAGLIEEVMDPDETGQDLAVAANVDLSRFRNVPQRIAARLKEHTTPDARAELESARLRFEAQIQFLKSLAVATLTYPHSRGDA